MCSYLPENEIVRQKKSGKTFGLEDPTTAFFSLSLGDLVNRIETVLCFDSNPVPNKLINNDSGHSISTVAFQFFMNSTVETIANPAIRKVMTTDMIRVSFAVSSPRNFPPVASCSLNFCRVPI